MLAAVADIVSDPMACPDDVDERSAIAGKIQDRGGRIDVSLKIPCDLTPHSSLPGSVRVTEPARVDRGEVVRPRGRLSAIYHKAIPWPNAPQTSTTSLPPMWRPR